MIPSVWRLRANGVGRTGRKHANPEAGGNGVDLSAMLISEPLDSHRDRPARTVGQVMFVNGVCTVFGSPWSRA